MFIHVFFKRVEDYRIKISDSKRFVLNHEYNNTYNNDKHRFREVLILALKGVSKSLRAK